MGEPHALPTIIDDMGGLYSHTSEAYRAGKRMGRDDFFRAVQLALSQISVKYESGPVSGPEEPLATRGFHVAEECCKAVRELKERFDAQKQSV